MNNYLIKNIKYKERKVPLKISTLGLKATRL